MPPRKRAKTTDVSTDLSTKLLHQTVTRSSARNKGGRRGARYGRGGLEDFMNMPLDILFEVSAGTGTGRLFLN